MKTTTGAYISDTDVYRIATGASPANVLVRHGLTPDEVQEVVEVAQRWAAIREENEAEHRAYIRSIHY